MKIPKDLKLGDKLWFSKTAFGTVCATDAWRTGYDCDSVRVCCNGQDPSSGKYDIFMLDTGKEYDEGTGRVLRTVIKIERIKPEMVPSDDNDVAFLLKHIKELPDWDSPPSRKVSKVIKQLRSITERLRLHPLPVMVSCETCHWSGPVDDCRAITDVSSRVAPGEVMPYGECPACGACCHKKD